MATLSANMFRIALFVSAASMAITAITAFVETRAENAAPPAAPVAVSVAIVEQREADTWDEFSGRLEAIERVEVRSRVAGAVEMVHFREGALVKAGDPLVTIDPTPFAAEVDRLEAQVAASEARAEFTKSEVDRARQLAGTPALSQRELESRSNTSKEAVANLRAAKAALQTARLNLTFTEVRAPVAGRVGRREITVGNLVDAGPAAPVLTRLVSVDPIYAGFNADEVVVARAFATLSPDAAAKAEFASIRVQMSVADGTWKDGRLQLIDNQVDPTSGTIRVRAQFENKDGRLIPGQFVRIRLAQPRQAPVVAISERAIGTDQNKKFVLIVDGNNKTVYREVKLGGMTGAHRIIASGLAPKERIVVAGLQRVKPGIEVTPEPASMDGASATAQTVANEKDAVARQ